jgi:hypothetical protein
VPKLPVYNPLSFKSLLAPSFAVDEKSQTRGNPRHARPDQALAIHSISNATPTAGKKSSAGPKMSLKATSSGGNGNELMSDMSKDLSASLPKRQSSTSHGLHDLHHVHNSVTTENDGDDDNDPIHDIHDSTIRDLHSNTNKTSRVHFNLDKNTESSCLDLHPCAHLSAFQQSDSHDQISSTKGMGATLSKIHLPTNATGASINAQPPLISSLKKKAATTQDARILKGKNNSGMSPTTTTFATNPTSSIRPAIHSTVNASHEYTPGLKRKLTIGQAEHAQGAHPAKMIRQTSSSSSSTSLSMRSSVTHPTLTTASSSQRGPGVGSVKKFQTPLKPT